MTFFSTAWKHESYIAVDTSTALVSLGLAVENDFGLVYNGKEFACGVAVGVPSKSNFNLASHAISVNSCTSSEQSRGVS